MSTRTHSANPASPQQVGIADFLLALAAIGVAVVAGAWYALRDGSTSTTVTTTANVAPVPEPWVSFSGTSVRTPATIFVVATQSQKASVEAGIEEAERIRHSTGAEAAKETVVIMAFDEALIAYAESVETSNSHLASLGLSGDVIVDLRSR